MGIPILLIIFVLLADQGLKYWVVQHIALGTTIGHNPFIDLTYLQNRGAAWSMFNGKVNFLLFIAIAATLILFILLLKNYRKSSLLAVGLALALGGTLGNMLDRLRLGYVIDMFQLELFSFPIFNIADIALCLGVFCIIIYIMKSDA